MFNQDAGSLAFCGVVVVFNIFERAQWLLVISVFRVHNIRTTKKLGAIYKTRNISVLFYIVKRLLCSEEKTVQKMSNAYHSPEYNLT